MRIREKKNVVCHELVAVVCDRCKTRCEYETGSGHDEFITLGGTGGFWSKHWGDETRWSADLCEKCSHELFSEFAVIES